MNYTYLLRCADGTLYCGWTNHLAARVAAHNAGKGAKYTKARRPVLVPKEATTGRISVRFMGQEVNSDLMFRVMFQPVEH